MKNTYTGNTTINAILELEGLGDFEELYKGLVFILFYSKRCPVCRDVLNWWYKLVKNYKGQAVFLTLPYNKETRRLFDGFSISYVPALIVIKDGRIVARIEPVKSRQELELAVVKNIMLTP